MFYSHPFLSAAAQFCDEGLTVFASTRSVLRQDIEGKVQLQVYCYPALPPMSLGYMIVGFEFQAADIASLTSQREVAEDYEEEIDWLPDHPYLRLTRTYHAPDGLADIDLSTQQLWRAVQEVAAERGDQVDGSVEKVERFSTRSLLLRGDERKQRLQASLTEEMSLNMVHQQDWPLLARESAELMRRFSTAVGSQD